MRGTGKFVSGARGFENDGFRVGIPGFGVTVLLPFVQLGFLGFPRYRAPGVKNGASREE